jgi:hypothetical protein
MKKGKFQFSNKKLKINSSSRLNNNNTNTKRSLQKLVIFSNSSTNIIKMEIAKAINTTLTGPFRHYESAMKFLNKNNDIRYLASFGTGKYEFNINDNCMDEILRTFEEQDQFILSELHKNSELCNKVKEFMRIYEECKNYNEYCNNL